MAAKVNTDPKLIDEILSRGTEEIFIREDLRKKLLSGEKLRIKLGVDPTSSHIHIGRAIPLRKLRDFQRLGHKVVFIVGDFTARIGDASDKLNKRPMLSSLDIKNNLKTYKAQVGKILDLSKAEFYYNSKWLSKLKFAEIAELAESFSVQQMIARKNFKDRYEGGEEISLREFLYPLMQGFDSVAIKADVEIGGFDQLFNLKAGRVIQKHYKYSEQNIMTFKMLLGTDGRKMSSSWGNIIAIDDTSDSMFGKVMSIKDELVPDYLDLTTDFSVDEISDIKNKLGAGENPKNIKLILAREIVRIYHGEKEATKALENFESTFSKKEIPENIQEVSASNTEFLSDVLFREKVISSKSDFVRLTREGAITELESNKKITEIKAPAEAGTYKIGKHRFIKIKNK